MKCGWDREVARKHLKAAQRLYSVTVLLVLITTLFVELSAPPRFAVAMLVFSCLVAVGGLDWVNRVSNASKVRQAADPGGWEEWSQLSCPRKVRVKEESKLATERLLTGIGAFVALVPLGALLLIELHAYPSRLLTIFVLMGAVPCFAGVLALLVLLAVSFKKSRRLVTRGEVTIGTIVERRRNTVTYDFKDSFGRVVSASSVDSTGLFDPGMPIPVFFNPENPSKDQVALCGSPYEVAASIPTDHRG